MTKNFEQIYSEFCECSDISRDFLEKLPELLESSDKEKVVILMKKAHALNTYLHSIHSWMYSAHPAEMAEVWNQELD